MINAYDKNYLERARAVLGSMLDFAVNKLGLGLREFWDAFLASNISKAFQAGDSSTIAGRSGIELAYEVLGEEAKPFDSFVDEERSTEYWTGWALCYFQWEMNLTFNGIDESVPIENIITMYSPYHELDIRHFCGRMRELIKENQSETNLKRLRKYLGLTQIQLAKQTNIPVRTIQQYEQGQKNINCARSEYVVSLSKALYCSPEDLLEK